MAWRDVWRVGWLLLGACGAPADLGRNGPSTQAPSAGYSATANSAGTERGLANAAAAAQTAADDPTSGPSEDAGSESPTFPEPGSGVDSMPLGGGGEEEPLDEPSNLRDREDDRRSLPQARGCDAGGEFETKMGAEIAARVDRHQTLVALSALENELDIDLLNAVCYLESKFDARARRGKNKGLMQLGPGATSTMASDLKLRPAPYDPSFALRAGARLLSRLIARYDGDVAWALVAYQRGVGGAAKIFRPGEVPDGARGYPERVFAIRELFSQSRWAGRCQDPGASPAAAR